MNSKLLTGIAGAALCVLALGGCQSQPTAPADDPSAGSESTQPPEEAAEGLLTTAETDLGTVVVDAAGMTVYIFDKDTAGSGTSSCEGDCLVAWPPVVADSPTPTADGVSGELGTITRTDGTEQVTLNGLPLYYFAKDQAAGDVTGQGVGGVWWVVDESGEKVMEGGEAG